MNAIKVVYFGTPEFSAYILEKLIETFTPPNPDLHIGSVSMKSLKLLIQAVVTSPDKPIGRKQIITPSSVAIVAEKYNIPSLKPEKLNEEFIKSHLDLVDCDLFVVASYGKLLPKKLLDIPKYGAINVHPSLLPAYRGPSPYVQPILDGLDSTGVTIMLMDEKMDHGDILSSKQVSIVPKDTSETLGKKLSHEGAQLLIKTIPENLSGEIKPKPQDHERATFTKILTKENGYFDINNPPSPEVLERMVRAYYPWPGVWTRWNNKIIKFLPNSASGSNNITIQQFNNLILIQMEGKKPVDLKSFLNGYPSFPLKTLL